MFGGGDGRDDARQKTQQLLLYAKCHAERTGEREVNSLNPLAEYAVGGERALIGPWGQRFQFQYVEDKQAEHKLLVVWTVNPRSGKKIGSPEELLKEVDKK